MPNLKIFKPIKPEHAIVMVLFLTVVTFLFTLLFALQQKTFDGTLRTENGKVVFQDDGENGEVKKQFRYSVTRINGEDVDPIVFEKEPGHLKSYEKYNQFFELNEYLFFSTRIGVLIIETEEGLQFRRLVRDRQIADLPRAFWIQISCSLLVLLISGMTWSYRRSVSGSKIFFVMGIGFCCIFAALSIITTRDLFFDSRIFLRMHQFSRLAMIICAYGSCIFLMCFPRPLFSKRYVIAIWLIALTVFSNELFQMTSLPFHDFHFQFVPPLLLNFVLAHRQWKKSDSQPVERASIKYVLLAAMVGNSLIVILFVMPNIINHNKSINLELTTLIASSGFVAIAFGISRYRLFDVERMWLEAWMWCFASFLIFSINTISNLIADSNSNKETTLGLIVIGVGIFYLVARHWVIKKHEQSQKQSLQDVLPNVVRFLTEETTEPDQFVNTLFVRLFSPLQTEWVRTPIALCTVVEHGLVLKIPSIGDQSHLEIVGNGRGKQLFTSDDCRLAQQLVTLIRYGEMQKQKQIAGRMKERERIMRDLHDDVCAKLLTLIHQSNDELAPVARSALNSLRETIYSLEKQKSERLSEHFETMQLECSERCEVFGLEMKWHVSGNLEKTLSTIQQINITRIVREAFSNIFKHANATQIQFFADECGGRLSIKIVDNGHATSQVFGRGNGLLNMERRTKELDGEISLELRQPTGLVLNLSFPLETKDVDKDIEN